MILTMTRPPRGRYLSARDAERLLGIPAATVRSWHRRHLKTGLYPVAEDRRGNPMFDQGDLEKLRSGRPLRNSSGERG